MEVENLRADIHKLNEYAVEISEILRKEILRQINIESIGLTKIAENKIIEYENIDNGIYRFNKCIDYYKAIKGIKRHFRIMKRISDEYIDQLSLGIKLKDTWTFGDGEYTFDQIRYNLTESVLYACYVIPSSSRTPSLEEFIRTNKDLKYNGKPVDENIVLTHAKNSPRLSALMAMGSTSQQGEHCEDTILRAFDTKSLHFESNRQAVANSFMYEHPQRMRTSSASRDAPFVFTARNDSTEADNSRTLRLNSGAHSLYVPNKGREQDRPNLEIVGSDIVPRPFATDAQILSRNICGVGLDAHVEYRVAINTVNGENLELSKRYTDFERLRLVMKRMYPMFGKNLPKLPPKRILGNFNDVFLDQRENSLQYLLSYIALHPILGSSMEFRTWCLSR